MWRGVSVMQVCCCGDRQLLNDLPKKMSLLVRDRASLGYKQHINNTL